MLCTISSFLPPIIHIPLNLRYSIAILNPFYTTSINDINITLTNKFQLNTNITSQLFHVPDVCAQIASHSY